MKRTVFCLIVVLLLLLMMFPFFTALIENKTIYVDDDDNIDGPWDGTIEHPYNEIQNAINAANDGDTVFVFEGIYKQIGVLGKNIEIIGEDNKSTIIEPQGSARVVCWFSNSDLTLKNFCIRKGLEYGVYISEGGFNTISDNIIDSNDVGILIYGSNDNIIENNIISNSKNCGISISSCNRNIIEHNIISNTTGICGISIFEIRNSLIKNNNIINNKCGINVYWEKSRQMFTDMNRIIDNNFKDNSIHAGISADWSSVVYTQFFHNYWGQPRIFPKIIWAIDPWGNIGFMPCNIDFYPALLPIINC